MSSYRDSKFYVNAKNSLGLDFQKTRAKMLALSLSSPENYFLLRQQVIESITEEAVSQIYDKFWQILGKGRLSNNTQIEYTDKNGASHNFEPNLPEQEIAKFSMMCAKHIQDISESAVNMILPADYHELAVKATKARTALSGVSV